MKPYEKIILSYINKYHQINLEQLSYEVGINSSTLSDILRDLYRKGYFTIDNEKVFLTESEQTSILSSWDDLSYSSKDFNNTNKLSFNWDYLYIPKDFDNI